MPADDEAASGPPPDPLDRLWFHPSELGAGPATLHPVAGSPKVWLVALLSLLVGICGTLGVVMAVDGLRTREQATESSALEPALAEPDAVATLVSSVGHSIVTITITPVEGGDPSRAGSGVVVRAGRVLTAAHLVTGEGEPAVVTIGGQVGRATVKGIDPETDLALLEVDGADLVPARLGTGDGLRIGQSVAALSAGPAPNRWVSAGVISGLDRMSALASKVQGVALIETDVRFDDGAGGGALLDDSGAVVGILTGADHYAVPIDVARDVAAQLDLNGRAAHGWSGLVGTDALDRPGGGVRIRAVIPGSPAEVAGLLVDDIVLRMGDVDVGNLGELVGTVRRLKPGDPVEVSVIRGGQRLAVALALGQSVATPSDGLTVA